MAKVTLPPAAFPWADEVADEWIEWIVGSGIDVIGDVEDLRPVAARGRHAVGRTRTARAGSRWSTPRSTRWSRWPWRPRTGPTRTSRSPPGSAARPVGCGASDLRPTSRRPGPGPSTCGPAATPPGRPGSSGRPPATAPSRRAGRCPAPPSSSWSRRLGARPAGSTGADASRRSPTWCSAGPVRAAAARSSRCRGRRRRGPAPLRGPAGRPLRRARRRAGPGRRRRADRAAAAAPPTHPPPVRARRRLFTRTPAFTLAGAPVTTSVVRQRLEAAGHVGGRRPAPRPAGRGAASTSPLAQVWSARVQRGAPVRWPGFVERWAGRRELPPSADYPALARLWAERVGAAEVHVLLAAADPATVTRDVARLLDVDPTPHRALRDPRWRDLSPAAADVVRRVNAVLNVRSSAPRHEAVVRTLVTTLAARRAPAPARRARAVPGLGDDAGPRPRRGARAPADTLCTATWTRSSPGSRACPRARGASTCWTSCWTPASTGPCRSRRRKADQR